MRYPFNRVWKRLFPEFHSCRKSTRRSPPTPSLANLRSPWSPSCTFQPLSCKDIGVSIVMEPQNMLIHCRWCREKRRLGQLTARYPWAGDLSKVNKKKKKKAQPQRSCKKWNLVCHFLSPYFWYTWYLWWWTWWFQALGGRNMVGTRIGRKPRSCWPRVGCMMSEWHLFSFYIRMEPLFAAWNGAGRPPKSWEPGNFVLKWAV